MQTQDTGVPHESARCLKRHAHPHVLHDTDERYLMKFRKPLLSTLAVLACAGILVLAGCGSSSKTTTTAAATDTSADIKTLTVGFDQAYPPYGFVGDDAQYTGFDLELAKEVCARNGWELKLEPIDWDTKDTQLNSGTVNCLWNGFTMEGRESNYTFSDPYMLNGQVIVVKKDSPIKSLADLSGKTVITQADSSAQQVLQGDQATLAATFGTLDTVGDYNTAFRQLETGANDAVACDLSIAKYQLAAQPDAYRQLDESLSSEHYAIGFKKGDQALATKVSDTLKAMNADGFIKKLCDSYASYGISYDNWILK